jgi:hypothetical protein
LWACGFCFSLSGNPLALPHPRAIEIAVATRAAIDKGLPDDRRLIPSHPVLGGADGLIALHKVPAPLLVKCWAAKLPAGGKNDRPLSVHFLFIDTEQSCGLSVRGGAVLFESKSSPHSDARVVTTRATFYALLRGELNAKEAQRLGLLCVEGDQQATRFIPGPSS